jgi:hypothetical protein
LSAKGNAMNRSSVVLKVQIANGRLTDAAIDNSGRLPKEGELVTFHVYSNTMKAIILDMVMQGQSYHIAITDEKPRHGEWFEAPMKGAKKITSV